MYCFFFKQKTAYEMRISDWSSDVCSSDLLKLQGEDAHTLHRRRQHAHSEGGDEQPGGAEPSLCAPDRGQRLPLETFAPCQRIERKGRKAGDEHQVRIKREPDADQDGVTHRPKIGRESWRERGGWSV